MAVEDGRYVLEVTSVRSEYRGKVYKLQERPKHFSPQQK